MTIDDLTPIPALNWFPNTDGIFSMPDPDYRKAPGVSQSMLKELRRSAAHLKVYMEQQKESTHAQEVGTLTDHALLEPDKLVDTYYVRPEGLDFRSADGKKWKADHPGRVIITVQEEKDIQGMVASVLKHPVASSIVMSGFTQPNVFCHHASTGLLRKGRLDKLLLDSKQRPAIGDLKTCENGSPWGFISAVDKYGYYIQNAYYAHMIEDLLGELPAFVFIAVEKNPPYACTTYQLGPKTLSAGRKEFEKNLVQFKQCVDSDEWPAYSQQIEVIELSDWKLEGRSPVIPD